jgi:hypothetical protein
MTDREPIGSKELAIADLGRAVDRVEVHVLLDRRFEQDVEIKISSPQSKNKWNAVFKWIRKVVGISV